MEQGIMLFTNGLLFVCTTGLAKLTNSNYLASKVNKFHIPYKRPIQIITHYWNLSSID